jgi:hypothetical protein
MRRLPVLVAAAVACLALVAPPAAAQDQSASKYTELLRQDLRTQKTAVVTEAMNLTDAQGTVFWPLYDQYSLELRAIWDQTIVLIKDYAENYDRMTNDKSKEIVSSSFKLDEQRTKLWKKYYDKYAKQIDPMVAARFVQVERTLNALIELQIRAELPLVK